MRQANHGKKTRLFNESLALAVLNRPQGSQDLVKASCQVSSQSVYQIQAGKRVNDELLPATETRMRVPGPGWLAKRKLHQQGAPFLLSKRTITDNASRER
jgi:hypothetical protein